MPNKNKRILIRLAEAQADAFEERCLANSTQMSKVLRTAITQYLCNTKANDNHQPNLANGGWWRTITKVKRALLKGGIRSGCLFAFHPNLMLVQKSEQPHPYGNPYQNPYQLNSNLYNPTPMLTCFHCSKPLATTEGQRPSTNVILSIHFLQHWWINPIYKQKALGCLPRQYQGPIKRTYDCKNNRLICHPRWPLGKQGQWPHPQIGQEGQTKPKQASLLPHNPWWGLHLIPVPRGQPRASKRPQEVFAWLWWWEVDWGCEPQPPNLCHWAEAQNPSLKGRPKIQKF